MAIIQQQSLFSWADWDDDTNFQGLKKLEQTIDSLPDENLMRVLEEERAKGRDDHPVRAMWNSIVAMFVYGHATVESLRAELGRNAQLRAVCGFDLFGKNPVPSAAAYSRFITKLLGHPHELAEMFETLCRMSAEALPDFAKILGVDGKPIDSRAKKLSENANSGRRGEHDANTGVKKVFRDRPDGTREVKEKRWFGFKVHAVTDCIHELPVAFTVTKASTSELREVERIIDDLSVKRRDILDHCEYFTADRGYDAASLNKTLWDDFGIRPVIAIRDMRGEDEGGDGTRRLDRGPENITYDFRGRVYCHNSRGERFQMAHGGFEESRQCTKFRCPAKHYGLGCPDCGNCPVKSAVRIKLSEDRRIFTPLSRASYAWHDKYKKRTACERMFSRLAGSFGSDFRLCRGLDKVHAFVTISFCLMHAVAFARLKNGQPKLIRSLVA